MQKIITYNKLWHVNVQYFKVLSRVVIKENTCLVY